MFYDIYTMEYFIILFGSNSTKFWCGYGRGRRGCFLADSSLIRVFCSKNSALAKRSQICARSNYTLSQIRVVPFFELENYL